MTRAEVALSHHRSPNRPPNSRRALAQRSSPAATSSATRPPILRIAARNPLFENASPSATNIYKTLTLKGLSTSAAVAGRSVSVGFPRVRMATRAELDRRAHDGEVVVPGGAGGHSFEAQEHLAAGRHKGGETRAHQLGHEGYVEMGKKGGLASHGADPYQNAAKHGVHIDEHKFMSEASIEELDRRAREGEVIVPGGTGGHSLEAQKHLAEGRHKGGVTRAQQLGHEGYVEIGRKGGLA